MARVPSETPPAVVCAENIALLHALHTVPMLPSKNDLGPVSRRKDGYLLSFEQERNLAGALAFLSGISDNASHVTAVCIEEDRGTESLRVLLAINKKTPNDGDAVLQTLKSGLESVLGPLVRAGLALDDGGTVAGQVTEVVFKAIVTMCQKRILCRLRLGKNFRNRPRQPFKSVLQQAVDALKRHHGTHGTKGERGTKALAAVDIPRIIATARTVMGLVDAWRQHQVPARLEELIHGVCRLKDMPGFCRVINDIPNRDMPPEARKNLVNIVQKVARYRGIARFLYRMARAVPVVRRMSVVLVKLAPSAFKKTLAGEGYAPDISSRIVQTCGPAGYSHQQLDNVYRSLQTTRAKATADFQDLARKVLKDAKIHAEIQLLAYCEQQAKSTGKTRSMPRVLRSNKDTCFLCNTFIKMRGNMHTSRYHGRLYPGWRLPATLSASVHHRFNEVLSDQIRSSLATLQTRKKKTQYPPPNESTLTSMPSLSSMLSRIVALQTQRAPLASVDTNMHQAAEEPLSAEDTVTTGDAVSGGLSVSISPSLSTHCSPVGHDTKNAENATNSPGTAQSNGISRGRPAPSTQKPEGTSLTDITGLPSPYCPSDPLLDHTANTGGDDSQNHAHEGTPHAAIQGALWSDGIQGTASQLYNIQPFEIQVEYGTTGVPGREAAHKELRFAIEQIPAEEADRLNTRQDSTVVDVEELRFGEEVSCPLDSQGCFYITARDAVVKISILFL